MGFPEIVASAPLLAGLSGPDLDDFLRILRPVSIAEGAVLVRQGQPADCAYVLESGTAEAVTALPGGGQAVVARLGPGSVLGEMALLESGMRSATVIARGPIAAYVIERDDFRLLLAQRNPTAFAMQQRITLLLCRRLRELNEKIVVGGSSGDGALPSVSGKKQPLQRRPCAFDWRRFLPILPSLRRFKAEDIDGLLAEAVVFDAARGETVFGEGDPVTACYVVVRGAVEIVAARDGIRRRIGVLGPGRWCGILSLIENRAHNMSARTREDATLLELGRAAFERLYHDHTPLAARLHDAVNGELLQALARTNNHLTRLISQTLIRNHSGRETAAADVENLQRLLGAQDCRAGCE